VNLSKPHARLNRAPRERQRVNATREAIKVPYEPKTTSSKAMWVAKFTISSFDSALCEAKTVSNHKTISALPRNQPRLPCEAKAKALCANNEATAAPLTSSALLGSARLIASGRTKLSTLIASSCEASSTFRGVQPCLSREAKAKTPLGACSTADSASLSLIAPGSKDLCHEARDKAPNAKDFCREARIKYCWVLTMRLF